MKLETVIPDVANGIETDEATRVAAGATADAGYEQVVARKFTEDLSGCVWDLGELGTTDDRSQRSVDIENDRGLGRSLA
jgi:hypothetical protein